jgi:hypothetical protein
MDPLISNNDAQPFEHFDPGEVGTDYVDDTFEVNSFSACLDNR